MKRKIFFRFLIIFFIAPVIVLLFPRSVEPELSCIPGWAQALDSGISVPLADPDTSVIPFSTDTVFGYFHPENGITFTSAALDGIAISENGFISYTSVPTELYFRDTRGRVLTSIDARGYPMYIGSRLFLVQSSRSGITEWDYDREALWDIEVNTVFTDITEAQGYLYITTLDGRILEIDQTGSFMEYRPFDENELQSIYGIAVSSDRQRMAVVGGLRPQQLLVFQRIREEAWEVVFTQSFENTVRRTSYMEFIEPSGTTLIIERPENTGLLLRDGEDIIYFSDEQPVMAGAMQDEYPGAVLFAGREIARLGLFSEYSAFWEGTAGVYTELFLHQEGNSLFYTNGEVFCRLTMEYR